MKLDTEKRYSDALSIHAGACNPTAIAGTIHEHALAISLAGGDTWTVKYDPGIRLMVHQLAFLCGVHSGKGYDGLEADVKQCEE